MKKQPQKTDRTIIGSMDILSDASEKNKQEPLPKKLFFKRIPLPLSILFLLILLSGIWFGYTKIRSSSTQAVQYQTAVVEKGTIISSISVSGTVATSNSTTVTTQASGVISKIYVKDGDSVSSGDKIAEIDLDLEGKQRAAQSYASYQSAKNSLQSAQDKYYSLQSALMTKWKSYMDTAQNSTYENPDESPNEANRNLPEFYSIKDDWLAAEAEYKNQENVIAQAQTSLTNAWLSYQQTSSTVYAPISGTITGLSLQVGSFITAQSNSSGGSASQAIANVVTTAPPTITVNLTEIDTPKVEIGDKVTVTIDALPDKTFTGTVVSINTVGSVSSGVTTYPATIRLDVPDPAIFSNMAAEANIIVATSNDTLIVPSSAVKKEDKTPYVQIMKNGQPETNAVEIGISNTTQTEILSGLAQGDVIVTGVKTNGSSNGNTTSTRSVFSSMGGGMRVGGR